MNIVDHQAIALTMKLPPLLRGGGQERGLRAGTENVARVMIEGKDQSSIESRARRLASVIENALG